MSSGFLQLASVSLVLFLVQGLAALPWLWVLSRRPLREHLPLLAAVVGVVFVVFTAVVSYYSDPAVLARAGRIYMAVLQLQLTFDLFVGMFMLTLTLWPKGGAVALAAYQEGVRQPMFWLLTILGGCMMVVSV